MQGYFFSKWFQLPVNNSSMVTKVTLSSELDFICKYICNICIVIMCNMWIKDLLYEPSIIINLVIFPSKLLYAKVSPSWILSFSADYSVSWYCETIFILFLTNSSIEIGCHMNLELHFLITFTILKFNFLSVGLFPFCISDTTRQTSPIVFQWLTYDL